MVSRGRMIFAITCIALAAALAAVRWSGGQEAPVTPTVSAFHGATFDPIVQAPQIRICRSSGTDVRPFAPKRRKVTSSSYSLGIPVVRTCVRRLGPPQTGEGNPG